MAVKKEKQPGTGTREPVNKEEQCHQQVKFYKATRGEERNTVLQVRKPTTIGQQFGPGRVKRDHQHRPEGKLSQSEAENFRDEDEGRSVKDRDL